MVNFEADESDGSFIHIPPTYSIVTNIDREHMDFYKSVQDLKKYFIQFINKVPLGKSFICLDDKINKDIIKDLNNKNFYTYGTDYRSTLIRNLRQSKEFTDFDLYINVPNKKGTYQKDKNTTLCS